MLFAIGIFFKTLRVIRIIRNFILELQQSSLYRQYIERLGWTVVNVDDVQIFIKRIPMYGVLAKIQRPGHLPYIPALVPVLKKYTVRKIVLEPTADTDRETYQTYARSLAKFFTIHTEPFLPTKTILVDLNRTEEQIFNACTEAKRRAVRKAIKQNIIVKESHSIKDLLYIKNKSAGLFGEITTYGIDKLWDIFYPKNATILLAYSLDKTLVGGILLLFWNNISYYWIAGATKKGKKLFAPTLLVWEALKLSKEKGNKQFDFVGVFDERSPKQYTAWKGFTKFKEGFGGNSIYYPIRKK